MLQGVQHESGLWKIKLAGILKHDPKLKYLDNGNDRGLYSPSHIHPLSHGNKYTKKLHRHEA